MLRLTEEITLWQCEDARPGQSIWLCRWESDVAGGEFFVEERHVIGARQLSKKVLRDYLSPGLPATWLVEKTGFLDRAALAVARGQQRLQIRVCGPAGCSAEMISAGASQLPLQAKPPGG